MTKREQQEINRIKSLIKAYFDIVKKNICDSVPKTIITFLVKNVRFERSTWTYHSRCQPVSQISHRVLIPGLLIFLALLYSSNANPARIPVLQQPRAHLPDSAFSGFAWVN